MNLFWTIPPVKIVEEDLVEPSRHWSLAQQPIIGLEEFYRTASVAITGSQVGTIYMGYPPGCVQSQCLFWTIPPVKIIEEDVVEPSRH